MAILSSSGRLKKDLGLFDVYTVATGATLSSGFFLLPALAAAEAGPAVVFCYMLSVLPLLPGILSKIELATAMPRAGGEYYFIDRSLGPLFGTIGGLGTWCSLVLKTAFALVGIEAYLALLLPETIPMKLVAVVIAVLLGLINLTGARRSTRVQALLVVGLLALLAWFTTAGLTQIHTVHFEGFLSGSWEGLFGAAGLVCVSYMGLTNVASVAEEVKDPERNLTLGIFGALLTAVVVYGLGTAVIIGLVPPDALYRGGSPSLTPVADAAGVLAGRAGVVIMSMAAILACLSVGNAGILSASRYPLAMGRDHLLPRWLRHLNRFQTPQNAIFVTVGLVLVFLAILDAAKIAKLASAFLLLLFAFNCLAVIVMRESRIESYDPGFRAPFYPWLQVVGIVAPLVFFVGMGWLPILFTLGLITAGTGWYFYYGRQRVARGGAIYHLFARLGERRFEGLDRELRSILKEKGMRAGDPYDEVVSRAIVLDEPADEFDQIVRLAAEKFAAQIDASADQLATGFMEGTRVGATPVTKGVALPHLRMSGVTQPLMVLARAAAGVHIEVDADYLDHKTDQAIFAIIFLVSPDHDAAQHLRILAEVAPHVDDERFMSEWRAAAGEQQLKDILLKRQYGGGSYSPISPGASLNS